MPSPCARRRPSSARSGFRWRLVGLAVGVVLTAPTAAHAAASLPADATARREVGRSLAPSTDVLGEGPSATPGPAAEGAADRRWGERTREAIANGEPNTRRPGDVRRAAARPTTPTGHARGWFRDGRRPPRPDAPGGADRRDDAPGRDAGAPGRTDEGPGSGDAVGSTDGPGRSDEAPARPSWPDAPDAPGRDDEAPRRPTALHLGGFLP